MLPRLIEATSAQLNRHAGTLPMRLRHIEVFHAVYTHGSVTKAATALNVSQPSISKVLAHAEITLGFKLFERARGKLTPTPEAMRLYPHVGELFESLGEVRRVAANLKDSATGRIRIASTPAVGLELLPKLVASYIQKTPGVVFEIETLHHSEIALALRESRIDIGLAFDPGQTVGINQQGIDSGEFVLVAPKTLNLGRRKRFSLKGLNKLPLIALNERSPLGSLIQAQFEALDVHPKVVAVAETYHMAKSLAAEGVGVALVDELSARSAPTDSVQILPLAPSLHYTVSLLQLADAPLSRVCERFIAHLHSDWPRGSPADT